MTPSFHGGVPQVVVGSISQFSGWSAQMVVGSILPVGKLTRLGIHQIEDPQGTSACRSPTHECLCELKLQGMLDWIESLEELSYYWHFRLIIFEDSLDQKNPKKGEQRLEYSQWENPERDGWRTGLWRRWSRNVQRPWTPEQAHFWRRHTWYWDSAEFKWGKHRGGYCVTHRKPLATVWKSTRDSRVKARCWLYRQLDETLEVTVSAVSSRKLWCHVRSGNCPWDFWRLWW